MHTSACATDESAHPASGATGGARTLAHNSVCAGLTSLISGSGHERLQPKPKARTTRAVPPRASHAAERCGKG